MDLSSKRVEDTGFEPETTIHRKKISTFLRHLLVGTQILLIRETFGATNIACQNKKYYLSELQTLLVRATLVHILLVRATNIACQSFTY